MTRILLVPALAALWLALVGCGGGGGGRAEGPTITFTSNDSYEVESTGTTVISAAAGVLSNDPGATVIVGADTTTAAGGSVTVNADGSFSYTPPSPAPSSDSFKFRSEFATSGSTAVLEGTVRLIVGTFNPTSGGGNLTVLEETDSPPSMAPGADPNGQPITFTVSVPPTQAASFTFLADGTYGYRGNVDFSGADSFTYVVTNSGGRQSPPGVVNITVTDINDAPTVSVTGNVAADDAQVVSNSGFATLSVGPPSEVSVQAIQAVTVTCSNLALFATPPAIDVAGVLTFETAAAVGGTANCTVTIQDDGGTANGGVDTSAAAAFDIVVTDAKSPPVINPVPGPFSFLGNTTLTVPVGSGLLSGFTDPGDAPPDNPHPTVPFTITSAPAGTLTTAADGSFTYTPVAGSRANDSFTYVIRDDGGANDTSAAVTVNLTFDGIVWWVDNSVAGPGTGLQTDPFNTIALAEAVGTRLAGDVFRIRRGTGTDAGYDTGFTLLDGDRVIGEGVALTVGALTVDPAGAGPPILSEATSGTHAITLAANNTVAGVQVGATNAATNYALFGSAAGALVTTSVAVNSTNGGGVRAAGLSSGTNLQFSSFTSVAGEHGLRLEGDTGDTGVASVTGLLNVSASTSDGVLISSDLDLTCSATPTALVVSNSGTGTNGVSLTGVSTTQRAGLTTTGGVVIAGGTGLVASAANVSVANSGTQALTSTGGPALSLTDVNVGTANAMTWSTISATNPTQEGIVINTVEGTLTINGGTVVSPQNATSIAVRVQDSPAAVTLNNLTISSTAQVVTGLLLSGATGASVDISNLDIDLDIAGSTGMQVAGGHPGFTMDGATIDISTGAGAGDGLVIAGTAAGTYVIENTTVTTALGSCIVASGGTGAIEIRPTTSVTTSGGRALEIDMPSTGVGIQVENISATGGTIGVLLENTSNVQLGPAAGSTTLDGQSNAAISLDSVATATIRNLVIQNSGGDGIEAVSTSDLTVDGVDFIDNGNASTEHGIRLQEPSGTSSISASDFIRSGGSHINVSKTNGGSAALDLTITNGTYTQVGAPAGALDSVHIEVSDGASATVVVTGAAFLDQGTTADAIFAQVDGSGTAGGGTLTLSVGASSFATAATAVDVIKDGQGVLTTTVENSTFDGCVDDCVRVANPPAGTSNTGGSVTATIRGNTLGDGATAGSASSGGRGIAVIFTGSATETAVIDGNTVDPADQGAIVVEGLVGSGTTALDMINNTVVSDSDDGIRIQTGETRSLCARVVGNDATPAGGLQAIELAQFATSVFDVEDTPAGTDLPSQLAADNTGTPIALVGAPGPQLSVADCVP